MAAFSAVDAAFEGFHILTRRPFAVIGWGVLYLLFYVILFGGLFAVLGPRFVDLARASETGAPPDPQKALSMIALILPFELLVILAAYGMRMVIVTSVYRTVLRPDEGAPLNMGLGMAELMQLVVLVAQGLLVLLGFIAIVTVGSPLAIAVAYAPGSVRPLLIMLLAFAAIGALVFLLIRFSLAGPATFAQRNIKIFESWALTRGAFWSLLGAYVLAIALLCVAYFIVALIGGLLFILGVVTNPAIMHGFQHPGAANMAAMVGPMQVIMFVLFAALTSLFAGFSYAMMYGPAAHAYRAIAGSEGIETAF